MTPGQPLTGLPRSPFRRRGPIALRLWRTLRPTMGEKTCFVIMPFDTAFDDPFEHAIRAAAEGRGYRCHRADQTAGTLNLIHEMIHHIYEAAVVVADLTEQNANVLYELGVAHSSSPHNKTVMIARRGFDIPFDIGPYHVLQYDTDFGGIRSLREEIGRQIDFIENHGALAANPVVEYLEKRRRRLDGGFFAFRDKPTAPDTFAELRSALLRYAVLDFLGRWPEGVDAPRIRAVHEALGGTRKALIAALHGLADEGWVERKREGKSTGWRLSEKGKELVSRLAAVASTPAGAAGD